MTRQEIVDEIVLKRDSTDPFDVQRVEELRQMLVEIDLEQVTENVIKQKQAELEIDEFEDKLNKLKKTIKVWILVLSILVLLDTLVGLIITMWALFGIIPLVAAMLLIYFLNRNKIINMEVQLEIMKGKQQ